MQARAQMPQSIPNFCDSRNVLPLPISWLFLKKKKKMKTNQHHTRVVSLHVIIKVAPELLTYSPAEECDTVVPCPIEASLAVWSNKVAAVCA
jgi:tetrahydromethanopterin S-methyltransferase subunit H